MKKNYHLKSAYIQAASCAYIDSALGQADQPTSQHGGRQVTVQEVKNGIWGADKDGVVTKPERIALAQAWSKVSGKAHGQAKAVFTEAAKKYKLYDPDLLKAKPPAKRETIDPKLLKGRLKQVYDDGPSGGGIMDAYMFTRGKKTYYVAEVNGDFNYAFLIGTPDGRVMHEEEMWSED